AGQYLLPERSTKVVGDDDLQQPGVGHLEDVLVLERQRHGPDDDRRLPLLLELLVERLKALELNTLLADRDLLAREVGHAGNRRRSRTGDDDLVDVLLRWDGEIDELGAFGGDRYTGGDEVALSLRQGVIESVPRGGNNDHENLRGMCGLELCVDGLLELGRDVDDDASRDALIHEVVRLAVRRQDSNHAPLDHAVEVASPWADERAMSNIAGRRASWRSRLGLGEHLHGRSQRNQHGKA